MTLNVDEAMAIFRQTNRIARQTDRFFESLSSLSPAELARLVEPALRFKERMDFAVEELTVALDQARERRGG
jgi:hypothetical protein